MYRIKRRHSFDLGGGKTKGAALQFVSAIAAYTPCLQCSCLLCERLRDFSSPSSRYLHPPCRYLPNAMRWRGGRYAGYVGDLPTGRRLLSVLGRACARAHLHRLTCACTPLPGSRARRQRGVPLPDQFKQNMFSCKVRLPPLPIQCPRSSSHSRCGCKRPWRP